MSDRGARSKAFRGRSRRRGWHLAVLALLSAACVPLAAIADEEILIGVISPDDPSRAVGRAHRATIEIADEDLNNWIPVGTGSRRVQFAYEPDPGAADVVDAARRLVERGAVAILGPVDSDSTKAVVEAGLNVPILSALSTAETLAEPRSPWFFRVTLGDRERIQRYLAELRRGDGSLDDRIPAPRVVIYESSSAYGSGLAREIRAQLGDEIDGEIKWNELVGTNLRTREGRERVRIGVGFLQDGLMKLEPPPATVFVLGKSNHSGLIAQGVRAWRLEHSTNPGEPRFMFVGNDSDLRKLAPQGSWTIGEPTITRAEGTRIESLHRRFVDRVEGDAGDFVVTAYEAARFVIPEALGYALSALSSDQPLPSPDAIREGLRKALEARTFSSIEPWRRIRLNNGAMSGAPRLPVYQLVSEFKVRATSGQPAYLEVKAPPEIGFLQGPLRFRVIPHSLEQFDLQIKRDGTDAAVATLGPYTDAKEEFVAEYHPRLPGAYIVASDVRVHPIQPRSSVSPPFAYGFAAIGGLAGSLLVLRASKQRKMARVALGIATGLILTGLHFYRESVPFASALPQFGDSPLQAGFWAGVFGGLLGPSALLLLVGQKRVSDPEPDRSPQQPPTLAV